MPSLDEIAAKVAAAVPGATLEIVANASSVSQCSLRVDAAHAVAIARFLRADPELQFDYCSNVTGVDWLDSVVKEKVKVKRMVDGIEREFEAVVDRKRPGYLEVIYHLYSMARRHGPLVLRLRTTNRTDPVPLPSLTPVWRGAEFQEREVYDLYGIGFEGHPDLRRILMWEGYQDSPMRKDYVEPDDYEWEPTPHGDVLEKAERHPPGSAASPVTSAPTS